MLALAVTLATWETSSAPAPVPVPIEPAVAVRFNCPAVSVLKLPFVMLLPVAVKSMVPVPALREPDNPSEAPVKPIVPLVAVIDEPAVEVRAPEETALSVLPVPALELPVKFKAFVEVR